MANKGSEDWDSHIGGTGHGLFPDQIFLLNDTVTS